MSDDDSLVGVALAESRDKMHKAVEHAQHEFAAVRTGRASPALIENLRVDYYGTEVALKEIAGFKVPEARLLVVTPYDKGSVRAVEKAIQNSELGINPSSDGEVVRLAFPPLTEERRKDMVKVVHHKAEDGKVAVRAVRRHIRKELEAFEKDGDITADELERAEKELEKITHDHVAEIDRLLQQKEKELLEV